jgi:hypothetical protein
MKNQYFADVNDYSKYGLLRCFTAAGLRIGVCWMLTPDDGRSDGRKINYLSNPDGWRVYDPTLFDALANVVRNGPRDVRRLERLALLSNAKFSHSVVPDSQAKRAGWLNKALAKLAPVDLLFFDPDNGIEVQSVPISRVGSCKYIYWHEIELAWAKGSSLLIFQHFPRQKRIQYVSRLVSQLAERVPGAIIIPLVTSNVVYLLACQQHHEIKAKRAIGVVEQTWAGQIWRQKSSS